MAALTSIVGGFFSGVAMRQTGDYLYDMAGFNRDMSYQKADRMEQEAAAEENIAATEEARHRQNVGRLLGVQRTAYAKAGVRMSGSALLVADDTAVQGELDALMIRYNGKSKANAIRSAAATERIRGDIALKEGKMAQRSHRLTAVGTMLGAGGQAYGANQNANPSWTSSGSTYGGYNGSAGNDYYSPSFDTA